MYAFVARIILRALMTPRLVVTGQNPSAFGVSPIADISLQIQAVRNGNANEMGDELVRPDVACWETEASLGVPNMCRLNANIVRKNLEDGYTIPKAHFNLHLGSRPRIGI